MSDYAEQVPDKEKVKASVWKKSVFRRVYRKFSEYLHIALWVCVCVCGGGGGGDITADKQYISLPSVRENHSPCVVGFTSTNFVLHWPQLCTTYSSACSVFKYTVT